jgi:hypothetical protein
MLGNITTTFSFIILLVQSLIKLNKSRIIALELTLANNNTRDLLVKLVELPSPPINTNIIGLYKKVKIRFIG